MHGKTNSLENEKRPPKSKLQSERPFEHKERLKKLLKFL